MAAGRGGGRKTAAGVAGGDVHTRREKKSATPKKRQTPRRARLSFQVPPDVPAQVAEAAGRVDMTPSEWLRKVTLDAIEAAKDELPTPPDDEELVRLLGREARAGSVSAIKHLLALGINGGRAPGRKDPKPDGGPKPKPGAESEADAFDKLDELAPRRKACG
jgi:hypothetical protein